MAEINYTSLLRSTAADGKLAKTDQVYDEKQKKFQEAINTELYSRSGVKEVYVCAGDIATLKAGDVTAAIDGVLGAFGTFRGLEGSKLPVVAKWGANTGVMAIEWGDGKVVMRMFVMKNQYKAVALTHNGSIWTKVESISPVPIVDITNSLTSDSTASALAAAQGKVLKGLADGAKSAAEAASQKADTVKAAVDDYTVNGKKISGNPVLSKADVGLGSVTNDAQVKRIEMGKAGGVATLDSGGKVPSAQLPSYVDDVLEVRDFVAGKANIPTSGLTAGWLYYVTGEKKIYRATSATAVDGGSTPETGKIYVTADDNKTYRWSGSDLVEISKSIGLGETAGTAYDGKKGADLKKAYDAHAANESNPHGVTKDQVGLSNVTNDAQVKLSDVVDDYVDVKAEASSSKVASTNVTKRIITVQEACAPVMLDQIFMGDVTINSQTTTEEGGSLVYVKQKKVLAYRINGQYYNYWNIKNTENQAKLYPDLAGKFNGLGGLLPYEGKVYVAPSEGSFKGVYVCKDGDLVLLSDKTEVINSLTSNRTDAALSAAQGKALNDKLTTTTDTANSAKSIADSIKAALTIK